VYRWLAEQDVSAVIELPMDTFTSEYEYMLHATAHHKKMVNGVSGFAPPERQELARLARELPDAFVDALRAAGVDTVIVHADRYGDDTPAMRAWLRRELDRGRLGYVGHFDAKTGQDWVFTVRPAAGGPAGRRPARPEDLDVFLYGAPVCTRSVAGVFEDPPGEHVFRGGAVFRGWTSSPYGIKKVDVWFENRRVKYPARVRPLPPVARCPGPPPVAYELAFPSRPADVREKTDVQVEVTDGRGKKTVFDDRWIGWISRPSVH
jgi:hypothetical protein